MPNFNIAIALPMFTDDGAESVAFVSGYDEPGFSYDGFKNRVRIQPVRLNCETGERTNVGLDYTIGISHLGRIINEALS